MNDRPDPDLEARLRAALADRADSVEPAPGTEAATVGRMAAARAAAGRRRAVLSAAAVVAVVAAVAGAFVLLGDDDPDTEVATGDTTTTAVGRDTAVPGQVAIWPLPSMSVRYDSPLEAARTFLTAYVGFDAVECEVVGDILGPVDVPCRPPCPEGERCVASTTLVHARPEGQAWVVTGAGAADGLALADPVVGQVVPTEFPVVVPTGDFVRADVRALGELEPYDTAEVAEDDRRAVLHLAEGAAGLHVVVVTNGRQAVVVVVQVGDVSTSALAIWPLPTMSVRYDDSNDAAEAFGREFLGIAGACVNGDAPLEGASGTVAVANGCAGLPAGGPTPPSTEVALERRATGWVVTGAESNRFEVTAPVVGATTGADIEVLVEGVAAGSTLTAKVPALGQDPAPYPAVDTTTIPLGADGTWRLVLGAADGATVLVVSDGATATARPFVVDGASVPPDTTTTTTGATDDGVVGWPGPTSRHFDTVEAAAQAFVSEVLGFAEPALAGQVVEGADAELRYHPRPTASIETTIELHDTGSARGWVVTGLRSNSGVIDSVARSGDDVTVTGSASAFEATVNVRLLDLAGNVLGETITMAGGTAELEPFTAVVHQDLASSGPVVVQIAEGDESGEGYYIWAAWAPVPP